MSKVVLSANIGKIIKVKTKVWTSIVDYWEEALNKAKIFSVWLEKKYKAKFARWSCKGTNSFLSSFFNNISVSTIIYPISGLLYITFYAHQKRQQFDPWTQKGLWKVRQAFSMWERASPLTFRRSSGRVNIEIRFLTLISHIPLLVVTMQTMQTMHSMQTSQNMQNLLNQTTKPNHQTKPTKPNLPNQKCQTKPNLHHTLDHNRWIRFETGAHGDEDNFDGPGGRKRCKRLENNWPGGRKHCKSPQIRK